MALSEEAVQRIAESKEPLQGVLDHALADPLFLDELAARPLETAVAAGVTLTAADLKEILDVPAATDRELVEMLRVRIHRVFKCCGCGGGCGCA